MQRALVFFDNPAEVKVVVDARQRQFDFPELGRIAVIVRHGWRDLEGRFRLAVSFVFGIVGDGLLEFVAGERECCGLAGPEEHVDKRWFCEEFVLAEYA